MSSETEHNATGDRADPREPRHLWEVLEEEFVAIHRNPPRGADVFELDEAYRASRQRDIEAVEAELAKTIKARLQSPPRTSGLRSHNSKAYRMLGLHTIDQICADGAVTGLESFCS